MTTVLIDDSNSEGRAFVELLKKMKFAHVMTGEHESDWWNSISEGERRAIEEGLNDISNGNTVSHEQMKQLYAKWL